MLSRMLTLVHPFRIKIGSVSLSTMFSEKVMLPVDFAYRTGRLSAITKRFPVIEMFSWTGALGEMIVLDGFRAIVAP